MQEARIYSYGNGLLLLGSLQLVLLDLERGEAQLLCRQTEALVPLRAGFRVGLQARRLERGVVLLVVSQDRPVATWR